MVRDWITAERRQFADVLDGLSPAQWESASLCAGWSVAHVVAHLTMPFRISKGEFLLGMLKACGKFDRLSNAVASRDGRLPHADLAAALRDNIENPWKPPGGGYQGALFHDVVHGLDITWPLRIENPVPGQVMAAVLDMAVTPRSRKFFAVPVEDVRFQATDLDWSAGTGAPLSGRSQDLLLLLTGRPIPVGAFGGAGARLLGASAA
jgi:uncharacterized protein (TIGR03083 family)